MAPDRVAALGTQLIWRWLSSRYNDPMHGFFGQIQILLVPACAFTDLYTFPVVPKSLNSVLETSIGLKGELSVNPKTSVFSSAKERSSTAVASWGTDLQRFPASPSPD